MLFNRKSYNMRRDGITQSLLTKFLACPLKGLYGSQGWERINLVDRVRFGNICHAVCERLYGDGSRADLNWLVDDALQEYERANWDPGDQRESLFELDMAKAEAVMHQYVYAYPADFGTGKVFTGSELTIRGLDFFGWILMGKIDGVYKDKQGGCWLMETKTRGRIEEGKLLRLLPNDFQNQFYLTLYELSTGNRVEGVLYNVIRNPTSKPHQGETLLAFKTRLQTEISKNRQHYFKRFELFYTDSDRERFRAELVDKLSLAERVMNGKQSSYRVETACDRCDYVDLCIYGNEGPYRRKQLFSELD